MGEDDFTSASDRATDIADAILTAFAIPSKQGDDCPQCKLPFPAERAPDFAMSCAVCGREGGPPKQGGDAVREAQWVPQEVLRSHLAAAWTDFLDANPDDLDSPEYLPNHALVTCEQMFGIVEDALAALSANQGGDAGTDIDALTGCPDDQDFAAVSADDLRASPALKALVEKGRALRAAQPDRAAEATVLIAELIGQESSREFYGINEVLLNKLATISATLNVPARTALSDRVGER